MRADPTLHPEPLCDWEWFDINVMPPRNFIPGVMKLSVMFAAQRNSEFVTDLKA
jgi:hypothetical protein